MISNRTHSQLYFNMLRLNHKTKKISFCITPQEAGAEIFIPDGMYLKLTQYPFAEDQNDEYSYLFFATPTIIDFQALNDMITDNTPPLDDLSAPLSTCLEIMILG